MQESSPWSVLGELGRELLSTENDPQKDSILFAETPVDIETFLYGDEYLNLRSNDADFTLSQPQLEFVDNCSRIFPEDGDIYNEGVLQVGQGAGKDTISMLTCLRLIYLLSCLESPQAYFKKGSGSSIDIINVAPTAASARNIFFSGLTNYMRESPLFLKLAKLGGSEISVSSTMIEFPKHIRLISGNSEHESWQGLNAIMIVLDEIDAFKSEQEMMNDRGLRSRGADGVYNTAVSLVTSRYPNVGKVLSLSWPRFRGSFIQRKFNAGLNEERTYVPCKPGGIPYSTWDFNPTVTREELDYEYKRNVVQAMARYECNPPFAADALFKNMEEVFNCFDAYMDEFEQIRHAESKPIRTLNDLEKSKRYYIHVDLSITQANCALAITHNEKGMVVLDKLQVWSPPPGGEIDIGGVEKYIVSLRDSGYNITQCTYDGFQSANSLQVLTRAGIIASRKSVDRSAEAYHTLKDVIQQGLLDGYYDLELIKELLALDVLPNNKVAQRPGSLKDRSDAVCGAVHSAIADGLAHGVTSIGDMNSVFHEETINNDGDVTFDNITGRIMPKVNENGIVIMYDTCAICNQPNTMEYMSNSGRSFREHATKSWCLNCDSRQYINEEGEWVLIEWEN